MKWGDWKTLGLRLKRPILWKGSSRVLINSYVGTVWVSFLVIHWNKPIHLTTKVMTIYSLLGGHSVRRTTPPKSNSKRPWKSSGWKTTFFPIGFQYLFQRRAAMLNFGRGMRSLDNIFCKKHRPRTLEVEGFYYSRWVDVLDRWQPEIPRPLPPFGCIKPCKWWDELPTSTGAGFLPSTLSCILMFFLGLTGSIWDLRQGPQGIFIQYIMNTTWAIFMQSCACFTTKKSQSFIGKIFHLKQP